MGAQVISTRVAHGVGAMGGIHLGGYEWQRGRAGGKIGMNPQAGGDTQGQTHTAARRAHSGRVPGSQCATLAAEWPALAFLARSVRGKGRPVLAT